jgi:hypothetical protein
MDQGPRGAIVIRTREGAARRYNALLRAYRIAFAGGGMFGFDWPTLRANDPVTYRKLRILGRLSNTLPSRAGGKRDYPLPHLV